MKKINRWFAVTLAICMLLSVSAFAADTDAQVLCETPEESVCPEPEYVWPDCELPDVDFDLCDCEVTHIDVKVDSTYFVVIDGALVPIHGVLDPDTIQITVKTPARDIVYDFAEYDVHCVEERGMLEYRINLKVPDATLLAAIRWAGWHMRNVYFSADIILDHVPDALKPFLDQNERGQYVASLEDILYTGIQECTGGHGMRSLGNVGIPTGLDLYLCGADLTPHFATAGFTIKKVLTDSDGKVLRPGKDAPVFTFTVTDWMGNPVYFDADGVCTTADAEGASAEIQIQAGKSFKLTGLLKGCYVVTEKDAEGYELTSIKVGKVEKCAGEVLVGEDTVITFTNTQKGSTDPVDPVDPPDTDTGRLTIKKVLVDDKGEEVQVDAESAPVFTFTVKSDKGFSKTVTVKAGASGTLTLDQGTYTVTEAETDGYKLYSVNGQTDITSAQVRVGDEETTVTFANVKKDSTDPKPVDPDPDPKPDPDPDPKPDPDPDPKPDPDPDPKPDPKPDPDPSNPGGGTTITVPVNPEPENPAQEVTTPVTPAPVNDDAPKTGDSVSIALMALLGISACGMGAALVIGRKFRYTGKRCQ